MEILALLLLLQIKHYYADFVIQTYMQTVKKGVWMDPVGVSHSMDHVSCTLVSLLFFHLFILPISGLTILLIGLAEGIIHYLIDYTKVKFGTKDMTKPLFWNQFGLDQIAHQICYLLIALILVV